MKKKGFLIILILAVVFTAGGCGDKPETQDSGSLPERATITEDLGNGWVYFEMDGRRFLYGKFRDFTGYQGYMALTEISK